MAQSIGRFLFLGDYKLVGLNLYNGDQILDDYWNSPVYATQDPETFGYLFNGEIVLESFEDLPFKGYGDKGH